MKINKETLTTLRKFATIARRSNYNQTLQYILFDAEKMLVCDSHQLHWSHIENENNQFFTLHFSEVSKLKIGDVITGTDKVFVNGVPVNGDTIYGPTRSEIWPDWRKVLPIGDPVCTLRCFLKHLPKISAKEYAVVTFLPIGGRTEAKIRDGKDWDQSDFGYLYIDQAFAELISGELDFKFGLNLKLLKDSFLGRKSLDISIYRSNWAASFEGGILMPVLVD